MGVESRLVTTVGYTLAFASLCSLAATPTMQALADEGASPQSSSTSYSSSQSNAPVASEKSETVNVSTYADGSVKKVEVSTTLKANGSVDVADYSSLENLKPDDEDVWFSNEGELVWHSPEGNDVVYTGTTQESLPIDLKVTYRYNGSYITPNELPGKSGHVVIRYDYENNSLTTVDGVQVNTPFVAITGMLLDSDVFSNVKITNGKLIEDGDRVIAVGYAMPGLSSSLDIGEDADIPEYFEVEADVVDFELKSTLTMVSPDMLSGFDTSNFNTGEYSEASRGLASAMAELTQGSSELADGMKQLADGAKEISDGAAQLDSGLSAANNDLPALAKGVQQLHGGSSGLVTLSNGLLSGLASTKTGVAMSQQGAAQLADALSGDSLAMLAGALQAAAGELQADAAALEGAKGAVDGIKADAQNAITELNALKTSPAYAEMTEAQKEAVDQAIAHAQNNMNDAAGKADAISASIKTDATVQAMGALQTADFSSLSTAARSLADGLQEILDTGFGTASEQQTLFGAATMLRDGSASLDNGLALLEQNTGSLVEGMSELTSGVSQLAIGSAQLSEAMGEAAKGSDAMTEGLQQFNDQGISKITDAIDNKLVKLGNRFTAVTGAGGMYKNFAGITDGTEGSVKFVFETDAIESE